MTIDSSYYTSISFKIRSNIIKQKIYMTKGKNIDKYLDIDRKLKILWNMKVTVIAFVRGALGTVGKGLEKD